MLHSRILGSTRRLNVQGTKAFTLSPGLGTAQSSFCHLDLIGADQWGRSESHGTHPNGGGGGEGYCRNVTIKNVYMEDIMNPIAVDTS